MRNRQSPLRKNLLFFTYALFFICRRICFLVVKLRLPFIDEYKLFAPFVLNAYCPATPIRKPFAGFDPTAGTSNNEPLEIFGGFGGLCIHDRNRSGRSFCFCTHSGAA